jgi:hypothetical protein
LPKFVKDDYLNGVRGRIGNKDKDGKDDDDLDDNSDPAACDSKWDAWRKIPGFGSPPHHGGAGWCSEEQPEGADLGLTLARTYDCDGDGIRDWTCTDQADTHFAFVSSNLSLFINDMGLKF